MAKGLHMATLGEPPTGQTKEVDHVGGQGEGKDSWQIELLSHLHGFPLPWLTRLPALWGSRLVPQA